jgi:hypothetical protein
MGVHPERDRRAGVAQAGGDHNSVRHDPIPADTSGCNPGSDRGGADRDPGGPIGPPLNGRGRAGWVGIGQGELIVCAGEMIAEESVIELPKPPREIRSNCFTARPW